MYYTVLLSKTKTLTGHFFFLALHGQGIKVIVFTSYLNCSLFLLYCFSFTSILVALLPISQLTVSVTVARLLAARTDFEVSANLGAVVAKDGDHTGVKFGKDKFKFTHR